MSETKTGHSETPATRESAKVRRIHNRSSQLPLLRRSHAVVGLSALYRPGKAPEPTTYKSPVTPDFRLSGDCPILCRSCLSDSSSDEGEEQVQGQHREPGVETVAEVGVKKASPQSGLTPRPESPPSKKWSDVKTPKVLPTSPTSSHPRRSPSRPSEQHRPSSSWTMTLRKLIVLTSAITAIVLFYNLSSSVQTQPAYPYPLLVPEKDLNSTRLHNAAFQPPESSPYRVHDSVDTFSSYKYRNACNISSLDLHAPFAPLCQDRSSMLSAMSSGGRIGYDAPYMPRGCDMRWFSTEEVCEILSRFQKVIIVGDSMMRHVIGSINVLIRKDLGYGAVTDWNFTPQERRDCFCNMQFNVKACSVQGIFKTSDVVKNDPDSLSCPDGSIDVMIEEIVRFPIPPEEMERFRSELGTTRPSKPYAFVFGHGLWNDLDLQATLDWVDHILDATITQLPYLSEPHAFWPRLILTPNASGKEKPDEWLVSQGNKALMLFEQAVALEAGRRGIEHLGTWNMSIQSNKYDGVHVDLKGNLVKAMMVMNWLNMLEVDQY